MNDLYTSLFGVTASVFKMCLIRITVTVFAVNVEEIVFSTLDFIYIY